MAERAAGAVESAPPVLRVEDAVREALTPAALARLTTDDLARFLAGRRWFGAKGGAPRAARVARVIPLDWDDGSFAIAQLEVETESGARQRYQLPLAVRERGVPATPLAHVESTAGDAVLFDAVEDAAFRRHLADALARGARFEGEHGAWVAEPVASRALVVPLEEPIELGTAEQSNTSIRFGTEGIFKLFRKLERGQNPDVEIANYLTTRAGFAHTPALFGVTRFEEHDGTTLGGMLQEFLPGSVDGWSYVIEKKEDGEGRPDTRSSALHVSSFATDSRRLGEVTRALHDALAAAGPEEPDFVPEPTTPADVESWARSTEQQATDALALLERQLAAGRLPSRFVDEARALASRRRELIERVWSLAHAVRDDAGLRIRHHGDYHLGQVLRTATGDFMIIDFEGEPARPLEERRRKHCPLRDVAGMVRSFAYAAASMGEGRGGPEWEREAREAFLDGYLESGGGTVSFLPKKRKNVERLISLFETEKVFYELSYELNNRPDWVWIPMRGVTK